MEPERGIDPIIPELGNQDSSTRTLPPFTRRSSIGLLFMNKAFFNPLSLPPSSFLSSHSIAALAISSILLPLLMGYLIWDHSSAGYIYKSLHEFTLSALSTVEPVRVDLGSIAHSTGESSSSAIEGSEAVRALVRTAEKAKDEIEHQVAVTMPTEPSKIALWLAGILLAVVLTNGGVIDEPNAFPLL